MTVVIATLKLPTRSSRNNLACRVLRTALSFAAAFTVRRFRRTDAVEVVYHAGLQTAVGVLQAVRRQVLDDGVAQGSNVFRRTCCPLLLAPADS